MAFVSKAMQRYDIYLNPQAFEPLFSRKTQKKNKKWMILLVNLRFQAFDAIFVSLKSFEL
jgi:hypothetical protein